MKMLILLAVAVFFTLPSFAAGGSAEKPSSSQTHPGDANGQAQLSPGLDEDIIIYRAKEDLKLQDGNACNQCADPEVSYDPDNTSR